MTTNPGDALRLISPAGARPAASSPRPATGPAAASGGEFADLLARAAAGEIISGAPVTIARGLDLSLTDDQLARLSLAADRAEAEGLSTALMIIDGKSLLMDVRSRTILREVDITSEPITGIDGLIPVPGGSTAESPLPPPGPALPENPSLLDLLARSDTPKSKSA